MKKDGFCPFEIFKNMEHLLKWVKSGLKFFWEIYIMVTFVVGGILYTLPF